MGIDEFGYSGKTEDVLTKLKLDDETIYKRIEKLLKWNNIRHRFYRISFIL